MRKARSFKLPPENPPDDGGYGELERVIAEGGPGISEPFVLRTASGEEIVIPPLRDPRKELVILGTGGTQTFQKGVEHMAKELNSMYGENDTSDYKAWMRRDGSVKPVIGSPTNYQELEPNLFFDSWTAKVSNDGDKPVGHLYGFYRCLSPGYQRCDADNETFWISASSYGGTKKQAKEGEEPQWVSCKTSIASVKLVDAIFGFEVLCLVQQARQANPEKFDKENIKARQDAIHKLTGEIIDNFKDDIQRIGFSLDKLRDGVVHALEIKIVDIDLTVDLGATQHSVRIGINMEKNDLRVKADKCGHNCIRCEKFDLSDEMQMSIKFYNKVLETIQAGGAVRKPFGDKTFMLLNSSTPGLRKSFQEFQDEGLTRAEATFSATNYTYNFEAMKKALMDHVIKLLQGALVRSSIEEQLKEVEQYCNNVVAVVYPQIRQARQHQRMLVIEAGHSPEQDDYEEEGEEGETLAEEDEGDREVKASGCSIYRDFSKEARKEELKKLKSIPEGVMVNHWNKLTNRVNGSLIFNPHDKDTGIEVSTHLAMLALCGVPIKLFVCVRKDGMFISNDHKDNELSYWYYMCVELEKIVVRDGNPGDMRTYVNMGNTEGKYHKLRDFGLVGVDPDRLERMRLAYIPTGTSVSVNTLKLDVALRVVDDANYDPLANCNLDDLSSEAHENVYGVSKRRFDVKFMPRCNDFKEWLEYRHSEGGPIRKNKSAKYTFKYGGDRDWYKLPIEWYARVRTFINGRENVKLLVRYTDESGFECKVPEDGQSNFLPPANKRAKTDKDIPISMAPMKILGGKLSKAKRGKEGIDLYTTSVYIEQEDMEVAFNNLPSSLVGQLNVKDRKTLAHEPFDGVELTGFFVVHKTRRKAKCEGQRGRSGEEEVLSILRPDGSVAAMSIPKTKKRKRDD
jgi:hypothetical protein